jgi:hypothetical protein
VEKEKAGGVAQVIGRLPCKHEALCSNCSITKKKKEKEGRKET